MTTAPAFFFAAEAAYLLLIGLTGAAFVGFTLPGRRHWATLAGLSVAAGIGLLPVVLMLTSLAGARPSRAALFLLAAGAVTVFGRHVRTGRLATPTVPGKLVFHDGWSALGLLSALAIVVSAANVLFRSAWPGPGDIDVLAIWLFKAKWLYYAPLHPLPPVFRLPNYSYSHQDYPLGPPFLAAGLYAALGGVSEPAAKMLLAPIYLAVAAVAYGWLRQRLRRAVALAITALFVAAPTLTHNAGLYVAETPLVLMLTAALTLLVGGPRSQTSGELTLAGLFAAAAAFTKNEGLALLPVFGLVALILPTNRKSVAKSAGVCFATILPWLILRTALPRTHEDYGGKLTHPAVIVSHLNRLPFIAAHFLGGLFDATQQGLIWYVLFAVAAFNFATFGSRVVATIWVFLGAQLTLYVLTFVVTPWEVTVLVPMISAKLLTQAAPAALVLIGLHAAALTPKSTPAL